MIALGSFLLAGNPQGQTVDVIKLGGDSIFSGFGTIALIIAFLMMLPTIAMNMYGGSLASLTAADCVRRVNATRVVRVGGLVFIGIAATVLALLLPQNFLGDYGNFLVILLYFLIPWTAINLVDFYIVRRGNYAIQEIFAKDGIYGLWNWRGLTAYFVGLGCMVPFISTAWWAGPVAKAAGEDYSIFVGLAVSAILYFALASKVDRSEERRLALNNDLVLEGSKEGGNQ